jgi:hypothetical protein
LRPDSEEEMVPTDIRYDGAMSELVKTGKAPCEHMFSASPLRADIAQCSWDVRFVSNPDIDQIPARLAVSYLTARPCTT